MEQVNGIATNQKESDNKLKELILYICEKCKDDPSFDYEKLKRILYLADFRFYGETGRSITGTQYIREGEPIRFTTA